jgi:excisionase family DNA binding protein
MIAYDNVYNILRKHAYFSSSRGIPMPASDRTAELLTLAEAAKLLKVSPATLHRWLKDGRLRAYRVGPRAVRVARADLAKLLVPTTVPEEPGSNEAPPISPDLTVPPLTEVEAAATLAALQAAQALTAALQRHHSGAPLPASWPVIRQAREERAERL